VKRQIPAVYVAAAALLIVAAVAYVLLVRPKGAEQKRLDDQIASLQTQLVAARHKPSPVSIKVADLFRLTKAIPDQEDMPGIILELNSTASAAGIKFDSIEPQPAVASSAYWSVPINLVFEGSYYDLVDFLFRLRNLVSVNDGVLDASGRLFTLDSLTLATDPATFPTITAKLTVSAYVFGSQGAPGAATPAAPTSTETSSTPTDTTATSDASQQAAGGN
jgi:type IV pilus assembly protein PilO